MYCLLKPVLLESIMGTRKKSNPAITALNNILRRPDLSILGDAITSLPSGQWQERMFFMGVPDTDLHNHTDNAFPATLRKEKTTHPIFVLKTLPSGHLVCPCSSKGSREHEKYIRAGCRLEMGRHIMEMDSFLKERYRFTMPLDGRFSRKLLFRGKVPGSCIAGGAGK